MGFIPILLTLAGFILLFGMVVSYSINQKKEQYKAALLGLQQKLVAEPLDKTGDITVLERDIQSLLVTGHPDAQTFKRQLGQIKLLKHQYNELVQTKPYSLVAKLTGQRVI
ncbi:hypothetical protein FKX85_10975 [Echinicola soli]|uniref:Uncharacterized protein n=1 Tax=Echinicola soli TaxID=2591634 RepID=A0A514CI84_9BACT|nr:hypothetical protein [Echinicola soli]QDH79533.1 hypothetical protein FKX85_10975 [Echinicola soli]